jgi:HD-like signal output (HDOD) protein
MSTELHDIGDRAFGAETAEHYAKRAVADARALIEADPGMERWVRPLTRAIRHGRLRMPSLSATTLRVLQLIESPDVDLDELAGVVGCDPALATRIMGVANSTWFRGATEVPNVREALMRMGVREARTLVVVVALRSTLLRAPGLGVMAHKLWLHSLHAAAATQEIANELPPWESCGFLAGLLHDLGQLVVLAYVADLPDLQEDGLEPPEAAVEAILEATHGALGAMVLASWGFPAVFCDAVLAHHDPTLAPPEAALLARAIDVGRSIADRIEAGWPCDPMELDADLRERAAEIGIGLERLADVAADAEATAPTLAKLS